MILTSEVVELNESLAVVQVCVEVVSGEEKVCALGAALAHESGRHVELAQARALVLARQLLEQGLDAVNPDEYLTTPAAPPPPPTAAPNLPPTPPASFVTEPPSTFIPDPEPEPEPEPEPAPAAQTTGEESLPDVNW